MYIREYMRAPVITVTPDTLLDDALRTAGQYRVRRLSVVDNGKLVGLVTRQILRQASLSSSDIGLSTLGRRYHLTRMKVRDVMITDVITVTPDTTLQEAAILAEEQQVGALPVVDKHGNLVGIVTHTDLNALVAQLLGFEQKGTRLYIRGLGDTKDIRRYQIVEIVIKYRAAILSAFSVTPIVTQKENFIIHLDTEKIGEIVEELRKLGLEVEMREH